MLLYKITFQTKSAGEITTLNRWVGSKADASKKRAKIRQRPDYINSSVSTKQIDVPTNKKGLLEYLNIMETKSIQG